MKKKMLLNIEHSVLYKISLKLVMY